MLADHSKTPVGTINRLKAGEYPDCKYSTIKQLLVTLIGGTEDEYHCNELIEKELANIPKEKVRLIAEQNIQDIKASKGRDFRF